MSQKRVLTDRSLRALKPAEPGTRYIVWDTAVPGFGVRVTDKGRRAFIVMRRRPGHRHPIRHTIGDVASMPLKKARELARDALTDLAAGVHPAHKHKELQRAEAQRRKDSFAAVANDFIARHVSKLRSGPAVVSAINRYIVPRWGNRPVGSITRRDVVELLESAVDAGTPYMAHHLLAYTRKLFNWAIARDLYGLQVSPCDRISARDVIGSKEPRQRVLNDEEIRLFWRAIEASGQGYPFAPLAQLLLLTGQRLREVAEARWSELDLEKALWSIPPDRMKGDAAHDVPLAPLALSIFKSLPRFSGPYVFTTMDGSRPVSGYGKAKDRIDKAMRDLAGTAEGIGDWRFHDLRRTMRTNLSGLPVPEMVRELVIAHKKPGLHRVYDQHAYREEKRHALELWEKRLLSILNPAAGENVVQLSAIR